jgi:predicted dehydrogenase
MMVNRIKERYNVLIIGAGNIGAFFDTPEITEVLTHAHAYEKHEGFNLLGFIDVDKQKAVQAVALWGGKVFSGLKEAFSEGNVDIVSVAVPDDSHIEVLEELSQFPVKLVFTEKPLAKTAADAERILKLYNGKGIPVAVNYSRRYVPELTKIKADIETGVYGDYLTGTGYYGKGFLHNGSHMIDLIRYLAGEIESITSDYCIIDYYKDDPSVAAVMTLENGRPFYMQTVDCRLYTIFEIDMLFERRRFRMTNSGFTIEEHSIREGDIYKGYSYMVKTEEYTSSIGNSLYFAVDNIYNHLLKGEKLLCSIEDGYKTVEICEKLGAFRVG